MLESTSFLVQFSVTVAPIWRLHTKYCNSRELFAITRYVMKNVKKLTNTSSTPYQRQQSQLRLPCACSAVNIEDQQRHIAGTKSQNEHTQKIAKTWQRHAPLLHSGSCGCGMTLLHFLLCTSDFVPGNMSLGVPAPLCAYDSSNSEARE